MNHAVACRVTAGACVLALAACGGGSSGVQASDPLAGSTAAATATASNNALCRAIQPFYWEIGDRNGSLASGSQGSRSTGQPWRATDAMSVASASKWIYAAYAVQAAGGALDPVDDIPFLNFTSGHSNFSNADCPADGTVAQCLNGGQDMLEAANATFHYNAGHFQTHAVGHGLGPLDKVQLASAIRAQIGPELALSYIEPQLAGGARMTPADYGAMLRKMLGPDPSLLIGRLLGAHAVCTRASTSCVAALPSVVPEDWHYSLGHWVEDDPATTPASNFAFSSAGAFGFYPWIDATRSYYGIVAREDLGALGEGYSSAQCGRLIRLAWLTQREQ
jgi:hypothetical protein